jgi:hypothetical protein
VTMLDESTPLVPQGGDITWRCTSVLCNASIAKRHQAVNAERWKEGECGDPRPMWKARTGRGKGWSCVNIS